MRGSPGSSLIATCRCGKQKPVHKLLNRNRTLDLTSLSFQCGARGCRWVRVKCVSHRSRKCRVERLAPPSSSAIRGADDVAIAECGPCRLSRRARSLDYRRRRLRSLVGNKAAIALVDRAKQGDDRARAQIRTAFQRSLPKRSARSQANFRASQRGPRRLKSIRNLSKAKLSRRFHLCPLCWQLLYEPRHKPRWVTRFFHPICLAVWLRSSGQHWVTGRRLRLPPAMKALGRPLDTDTLMRGYVSMMRLKGYAGLSDLAHLYNTTKPNIHASVDQFFKYAPARWDYVFAEGPNRVREQMCDLVHELRARSLLKDPLRQARVVRLLGFGMDVEEVSALTGWSLVHVETEATRMGQKTSHQLQRSRRLDRQRAWRRRQRNRGRCLFCSHGALPGKSLCAKHRDAQREREMRARPRICAECKVPIQTSDRKRGRRLHPACAEIRRHRARLKAKTMSA